MRSHRFKLAMLTLALAVSSALAVSARAGERPKKYVGADGCKICHKKQETGNQFSKWQEGPHAKAYETLATDEARKAAAERGLEGDPQQLDQCLKCHVTAHGVDASFLMGSYEVTDGVGCESCHGAGYYYRKKKIRVDREAAIDAGLVIPGADICTACHNEESPTYKPFDYAEKAAQIAHPIPSK